MHKMGQAAPLLILRSPVACKSYNCFSTNYRSSATSSPPAWLDRKAASMNAQISSVSSIGTGGIFVLKNATIALHKPS